MNSSRPIFDTVQRRLVVAVATAPERATEEQKTLLAGLLSAAHEARRQVATI